MKTFLSADRRFLNPQAMENVELKAAVPAKDIENNPLFTQDMPWEIRIDNGTDFSLLLYIIYRG